jgi:hypothetical protein
MPDNPLPAAILKDPVTWLYPPGDPYVAMSYFVR